MTKYFGVEIEDDEPGEKFTCAECGHALPIEYQHEEMPGVCFLDYVSEKDAAFIDQVCREAMSK